MYVYELPYSGKVSLVQNFAELLVNPLEEIFVVLIFMLTIAARMYTVRTIQISRFLFRGS